MSTDQAMPFGELLYRHRQSAGLSQEERAERVGLSPWGVSDMERATRQPSAGDSAAYGQESGRWADASA